MRKISKALLIISLVISHVMCAVVAYEYATLLNCRMCSAPAWVAFYLIIPYAAAIAVCVLLALILNRKHK